MPDVAPATDPIAEKCMGDEMYVANAQTWDEVDSLLQAREAQLTARTVTEQFSGIVSNVLWSERTPGEKARLLRDAADALPGRLASSPSSTVMSELMETKSLWTRARELFSPPNPTSPEPAPAPNYVEQEPGQMRVFKDRTGQYRWFAVYSNGAYDRHNEVLPLSAHREYQEWVDSSKEFPELWLWHTPGSRVGRADMVDVTSEGFAVASGTFDAGRERAAKALMAMADLGVSHGFRHPGADKQGQIVRYRTFEISPLPLGVAANPLTGFTLSKEETMLTPEKKSFLETVLGAEETGLLERTLESAAQKAREQGIHFKDILDAATPAPVPDPPAPAEGFKAADLTAALTAAMTPLADEIRGLKATVDAQAAEIATLKEQDTTLSARMAAAMSPKNGAYVASKDSRAVRESDPLVEAAKEAGIGVAARLIYGEKASEAPDHLKAQFGLLDNLLGGSRVPVLARQGSEE